MAKYRPKVNYKRWGRRFRYRLVVLFLRSGRGRPPLNDTSWTLSRSYARYRIGQTGGSCAPLGVQRPRSGVRTRHRRNRSSARRYGCGLSCVISVVAFNEGGRPERPSERPALTAATLSEAESDGKWRWKSGHSSGGRAASARRWSVGGRCGPIRRGPYTSRASVWSRRRCAP